MEKGKEPEGSRTDYAVAPIAAEVINDVPDPDEDDLDDLDDMLDEFSTTKAPAPAAKASATQDAPTASGPGRPAEIPSTASQSDEDIGKLLQEQMAQLLGEIDNSPDMQKQIEAMMGELGIPQEPPSTSSSSASKPTSKEAAPAPDSDVTFQETIRKTMERMALSGDQATAAATHPSEDDLLAAMLKQMGGGGGVADGEEDFNSMLMGMMEQLTNKDILYEPMKELDGKYPGWLEKNRGKVGKDDWERYEEQRRLVGEIVERFERSGYSDEDAADREFIVDRMQKMQAAGSPPADLVGDMKDAQEALGDLEGCAPQ